MPPPEDVALYTQFGTTSNHSSEMKRRFLSAQGYRAGSRHCFNTLCSGFVLVDNEIPIEEPFTNTSYRGDTENLFEYPIYFDGVYVTFLELNRFGLKHLIWVGSLIRLGSTRFENRVYHGQTNELCIFKLLTMFSSEVKKKDKGEKCIYILVGGSAQGHLSGTKSILYKVNK
ncbi:hypothetical protein RND71_042890 [Anisodus tanguticus]|uniref:Neprosin PEP catalytic domain-containing protein n=1 Tax=Anisodus tanguticus TaxID=243964 RepID=A0AAE1QT62_9SOLA|nr:hypothetical protein RND71_042890 [Anisodus tanguticus]